MGLGIVREVAERDVLPVAGEVGEADRLVIEHVQETGRPAAMLDIGLTVRARGGEEDARLRRDEAGEVGVILVSPSGPSPSPVGKARALAGLHRLDGRREGDVAGVG